MSWNVINLGNSKGPPCWWWEPGRSLCLGMIEGLKLCCFTAIKCAWTREREREREREKEKEKEKEREREIYIYVYIVCEWYWFLVGLNDAWTISEWQLGHTGSKAASFIARTASWPICVNLCSWRRWNRHQTGGSMGSRMVLFLLLVLRVKVVEVKPQTGMKFGPHAKPLSLLMPGYTCGALALTKPLPFPCNATKCLLIVLGNLVLSVWECRSFWLNNIKHGAQLKRDANQAESCCRGNS